MIVGATLLMVRNGTGAPAMAASSVKISWSIAERPWPPYSWASPAQATRRGPFARSSPVDIADAVFTLDRAQRLPAFRRHQRGKVRAQLAAQLLLLRV